MFKVMKSGKRRKKSWKRMVTKVTFVGQGFTRKPPKYERFIRPSGLCAHPACWCISLGMLPAPGDVSRTMFALVLHALSSWKCPGLQLACSCRAANHNSAFCCRATYEQGQCHTS